MSRDQDDSLRRFNLADVMILVAGPAFGFALARVVLDQIPKNLYRPALSPALRWLGFVREDRTTWVLAASWVLSGLGAAVVATEIRRQSSHRRRRRYRRQGLVVCMAALIALEFGVGLVCVDGLAQGDWNHARSLLLLMQSSPQLIAPAVLVAWFFATWNGVRAHRDWSDRLGRVVGALWLALALALAVV